MNAPVRALRVAPDRFAALLGAVTVAWIACDGEGCDAYLLLPGDEGVAIDEAQSAGWETGNNDLCPECAAKESGRG